MQQKLTNKHIQEDTRTQRNRVRQPNSPHEYVYMHLHSHSSAHIQAQKHPQKGL